ncbi:MAG: multidrug transporter, partial [Pollutimonas bauzanensis]
MKSLSLAAMAAAMLRAGCASLAPDYERPALPVSGDWPSGPAYGQPASPQAPGAADIAWQQFIVDDKLRRLVAMALENNRDLR